MACPQQPDLDAANDSPEPRIAYVYGETPPDFAALAACGFDVVCLDRSASWCNDRAIADARSHGLRPVVFRMGYIG